MRVLEQKNNRRHMVSASKAVILLTTLLLSQYALAQVEMYSSITGEAERVEINIRNSGTEVLNDVVIISAGGELDCPNRTEGGALYTESNATLAVSDSIVCGFALPGQVDRLNASFAVVGTTEEGRIFSSRSSLDVLLGGAMPAAQAIGSVLLGYVHVDNDSDTEFTAGDTLDFTYTLVNTGQFELSGISVADDLGTTITCPASTLAIGSSMVCTSSLAISAAAAMFTNAVDFAATSAAGAVADGDLIVALPVGDTTAVSNMVKSPAISNDANADGFASIGDEITYTFIIKNANFESLSLDMLTDPLDGLSGVSCNPVTENGIAFSGIGGPDTLLSQDTLLCTASLIVDEDDRASGQINNTASLVSSAPNTFEGANTSASATVTIPNFQLIIEKITTNSFGSFTFDLVNGDPDQVVLTTTSAGVTVASAPVFVDELGVDITITEIPDASFGLVDVACSDADGDTVSITQMDTSVTIAGADVDVGAADTASPITCTFTNDVVLDIAIDKVPSVSTIEVGEGFNYTITVTNLSTITAPDVVVEDILIDELDFESTEGCAEDPAGNPTCSLGDILPGESASFILNVTLNAAPASGVVENTATATTTGIEVDTSNNVDAATVQVLFEVPVMNRYGLLILLSLTLTVGLLVYRKRIV